MRFLLLILLFIFFTPVVHAQEMSGTQGALMTTPATASSQIQYDLPYPGLLPDNPLYILKAFRDRVVSFLINDPLKKSEFNLLNSDKRTEAGIMLLTKNKDQLAIDTFSKSNNYYENALNVYARAKKSGENTVSLREKLKTAMRKHIQLLEQNKNMVDKNLLQQYNHELSRMENYLKLAKQLK